MSNKFGAKTPPSIDKVFCLGRYPINTANVCPIFWVIINFYIFLYLEAFFYITESFEQKLINFDNYTLQIQCENLRNQKADLMILHSLLSDFVLTAAKNATIYVEILGHVCKVKTC